MPAKGGLKGPRQCGHRQLHVRSCIDCKRQYHREYARENGHKWVKRITRWRKKNKKRILQRQRRRRRAFTEAQKEEKRAYDRQYANEHRERLRKKWAAEMARKTKLKFGIGRGKWPKWLPHHLEGIEHAIRQFKGIAGVGSGSEDARRKHQLRYEEVSTKIEKVWLREKHLPEEVDLFNAVTEATRRSRRGCLPRAQAKLLLLNFRLRLELLSA